MSVPARRTLDSFLQEYLATVRAGHDDGECAGIYCPYCLFERQWPGKPSWWRIMTAPSKEGQLPDVVGGTGP